MNASKLMVLVAVILFVLAAFGAHAFGLSAHDFGWLGLAFGFGSFLV